MGRAAHFFTYTLMKGRRQLRVGKGGVADRSSDAIGRYLADAYGTTGWDHAQIHWHSTEGAAFKAERRKTDHHEITTGALPPWNAIRGGSGGSAFVRCKAITASGDGCLSDALAGNYGYCGVHRR